MNKEAVLYGIIGLLAGSLVTGVLAPKVIKPESEGGKCAMMEKMEEASHGQSGMKKSMSDMNHSLMGKTGEEFDKEFITTMIVHHEGAIEMANQAKLHAGHVELKTMADEIIMAQSKEIEQMKVWQATWGY